MSSFEFKPIKPTGTQPAGSTAKQESTISTIFNKEIKLFSNGFNDRKKEKLYSELAILINAGIDLKSAFEIIIDQIDQLNDKQLIESVKKKVLSGDSLSAAMEATGKFSPYEFYSIRIGEESGKLTNVLKDLGTFFGGKIQQKRLFLNALSYPIVVLLTAFGAVFFMMKFVVPMFADVFKKFDTDLPALTKFVLKASQIIGDYGIIFILAIITAIVTIYVNRNNEVVKRVGSSLILKIPFVGELIRKLYLSRLCHSLFLLTSSKIPLLEALELVQKMVAFYPISHSLEQVRNKIMHGHSLNESLTAYPIYDKRFIALIKVGEEANQLDMIFEKLSNNYSDDVKYQTGLVTSILEPVMIIFLGIFVAVILVSMYLPLFKLSSGIGK